MLKDIDQFDNFIFDLYPLDESFENSRSNVKEG